MSQAYSSIGVEAMLAAYAEEPSAASTAQADLSAALTALSDRVEILTAMLAASSTLEATDASAPRSPSLSAGIEPLRAGLRVLAAQRATHAENIANASVPGYKRRIPRLTSSINEPTGLRSHDVHGMGFSMLQGVLELTGQQLDLAIQGEGFFEIQRPSGDLLYTRNGAFGMDVNGRLVTAEGDLLTDSIVVPADTYGLSIAKEGAVFALRDENALQAIGTLRVHVFARPAELQAVGGTQFAPTARSGEAQARAAGQGRAGSILQGYLERSNVEPTDELIDLQRVEREAQAIRRALASHGIYTGG